MPRFSYFNNGFIRSLEGGSFMVTGKFCVDGMDITRDNYRSVAAQLGMPHSYFVSRMTGKNFVTDLEGMSVAFFDIETDDKENFLLGFVNDQLFDNALFMLEYMKKFDVIVGFNSFRFDYEVLFKYYPNFFDTIDYSGFKLHIMRDKINIDALFYYQMWKPWADSHALDRLAEEIGYVRKFDLTNKEEKCKEDVDILVYFYPEIKKLFSFFGGFGIDHLTYSSVPQKSFSKIRKWILQIFMMNAGIFPKLVNEGSNIKPEFFRLSKPGLYKDVRSFDVKSAYPTTAINGNFTLYEEGDFTNFMEYLQGIRERNPDLKETIKYIQNATIGDMGSTASLIHKRKIMVDIWNDFHKKMLDWTSRIGEKNIYYGYTDNVVTGLNIVPDIQGYEIAEKYTYKWFLVYNETRTLGMTEDGRVIRVQFQKDMSRLFFWKVLENFIDKKLSQPGYVTFLKDPYKPVIGYIMKKMPVDAFKIVIRKTDEVCRNPEYYEIWDQLKIGFNEIYLTKDGASDNPEDLYRKRYADMAKPYVKLYKPTSRKGL